MLRLCRPNELSLLSDIPWEELPRLFREAIVATLSLGYRYLWIDALGIIQDSEEDWRREAAVIGKVFSCSICTIATASAKKCHDGLFTKRNPLIDMSCRLSNDKQLSLVHKLIPALVQNSLGCSRTSSFSSYFELH